jgi:hypothetical protein
LDLCYCSFIYGLKDMITADIRHSLTQVLSQLNYVEHELNRPHEDVVALIVCLGARKTISELMNIYLMSNSVNDNHQKNLGALLNECKKFDAEFETIDLSKIVCNEMNTAECEGKYCLDPKNVNDCMIVANKLKAIVLNKLAISESELVN